ncbi:Histone-lysine N-methyltransferase SUV39H2 [Paramicrosporidium saccamoebae]|uniref:Histone-lysine N-methyltransferase SUV39H2 n=1 Tax=Paramicrosporidium saccamoebae TaxID=1246581 RepID=A0A2H9TPR4_9FUNG|nr:Histone-lysine N-methyltransferase SUV39H2 [Paramicrosporidium saccamoebae]
MIRPNNHRGKDRSTSPKISASSSVEDAQDYESIPIASDSQTDSPKPRISPVAMESPWAGHFPNPVASQAKDTDDMPELILPRGALAQTIATPGSPVKPSSNPESDGSATQPTNEPPRRISWVTAPNPEPFQPSIVEDTHNPELPYIAEPAPAASQGNSPPQRFHHTINSDSPPPTRDLSLTPSPPPSFKKDNAQKDMWFVWMQNMFSGFTAVLLLFAFSLGLFGYYISDLDSLYGLASDFESIHGWFVASIRQSKSLARITMAGVWLLVALQLFATFQFDNQMQLHASRMSKNWTKLSPLVKSVIQYSGNCCGYYAVDDRAGEYCPGEATEGCRFHIGEVSQGIKSSVKHLLALNFLIAILISMALIANRMQELCANSTMANVDENYYKVEEIIDSRISPTNGHCEFLVKWKDYSSIWNSWEPAVHLQHCHIALANFEHARRAAEIKDEVTFAKKMKENAVDSLHTQLEQKQAVRIEREKTRQPGSTPTDQFDHISKSQPGPALVGSLDSERAPSSHSDHPFVPSPYARRRGSVFEKFEKMMNSCGGELITVENEVDNVFPPAHFRCLSAPIIGSGVPTSDPSFLIGCTCHPDRQCHDGECACVSQNPDPRRIYSSDGRLLITSGPIYECNSKCSCPLSCPNRVVQRGRTVPLVIARYGPIKGWGVKAAAEIPKGTFIDVYLGELITTAEATRRIASAKHGRGSYLFDIDFNYEVGTESAYTIDAYTFGNVTHFINHSCEPNLRVHACFIDTADPSLHMLAFFAKRNIAKGEELCFDYLGSHGAAQAPQGTPGRRQPCSCAVGSAMDEGDTGRRQPCSCGTPKFDFVINEREEHEEPPTTKNYMVETPGGVHSP